MRNFIQDLKLSFHQSADALLAALKPGEEAVVSLQGEQSYFARFNGGKIRQNTSVEQATLGLQFQNQGRTFHSSFSMSGQLQNDVELMHRCLAQARLACEHLPIDAYQLALENHGQSDVEFHVPMLDPLDAMDLIVASAKECDLAGIYVSGVVVSANRNSKGQNHWFLTERFYLDYSLYDGEKAVKSSYAENNWNTPHFLKNLEHAKSQLKLMARAKKKLAPGQYKTYLAPSAVSELLGIFSWSALSYSDYRRGNSAFRKLAEHEKKISPLFHLKENFSLGLGPRFNAQGEMASEQMDLIKSGSLSNFLVSSRSAKEFSVPGNCANESESPRSLELLPGQLAHADILKQLGTGLYLSNLHYLNWSNRQNARVTGMTRYACFWVENGEIVAPIEDMRFDESIYDALGPENLLALTDFQALELDTSTYEACSLGGIKTPGMLLKQFTLTL